MNTQITTFEEIESALDSGNQVFDGSLSYEVTRTELDDAYYEHPRRDPYYVKGLDKYSYNIVCHINGYIRFKIGLQHRRTCECCNGTGLNGSEFFLILKDRSKNDPT